MRGFRYLRRLLRMAARAILPARVSIHGPNRGRGDMRLDHLRPGVPLSRPRRRARTGFSAGVAAWGQRARTAALEAAVLPMAFRAVTRQATLRPRSERRTFSVRPVPTAAPCPFTDQR